MFLRTIPLLLAGVLPLALSYDPSACNSSPSLCQTPYTDIIHLGTHDSAFVRTRENRFSSSANQYFPVKTQLSSGIRLLQNQIHLKGSEIRLCHTSCALFDAGLLQDYLKDVVEWMEGAFPDRAEKLQWEDAPTGCCCAVE